MRTKRDKFVFANMFDLVSRQVLLLSLSIIKYTVVERSKVVRQVTRVSL